MKQINKVLIIGSGPIVIGQAAEFDYSGTQACLAAREEGVKTVLVNSNPATIQTDHEVADRVYIEPLTPHVLEKIIVREKPDGIIATVGGQTALNLGVVLHQKEILQKYHVPLLGTDVDAIQLGEDRGKFKSIIQTVHQPVLQSMSVKNVAEASDFAAKVGFPVVVRSAFNLGGTGSGIATSKYELNAKVREGLSKSLTHEALVEQSVIGWAELEYEMIRDHIGNNIMVCNMENMDAMGIHTGESIVVVPSQTLSDDDHQMLRSAALSIVDALDIKGACNIQFALNQKTGKYVVIEVNPRLSRSSALASKATGYPIAKVATKIALGKTLPEITNEITGKTAFFEPSLDYVVVKIPKWPDDKFPSMDKNIGMTMKSTGEVMSIGRSFEEAMYKAIQSLDLKYDVFHGLNNLSNKEVEKLLVSPNTQRLSALFGAIKKGWETEKIANLTHINPWFIEKLVNLNLNKEKIRAAISVYKMVDTCAGEFEAVTPYFYSTHGIENEAKPLAGPKAIILGSGPIRIAQGIEFDYLTVHAVKALRELGYKAIIINSNPETVSTDYSISDRLYFEPLTFEFILKVIQNERDGLVGVIPQFGGQTAINLASAIEKAGIPLLGTSAKAIDLAEDRQQTGKIIKALGYHMPPWTIANSKSELLAKATSLGFQVLIRPSFVLGGEGMIVARTEEDIQQYLHSTPDILFQKPVLIDTLLDDAMEVDVDVVSDGEKTMSFILEQLEPAGIHSGDSSCVFPPQKLSRDLQDKLKQIAHDISKAFGIVGIANLQCAIKDEEIYILEVNPRASRTVPFLSKCLGISLARLATKIIMGEKLFIPSLQPNGRVAIKTPVFSTEKLTGVSNDLGPLMKSTGEAMYVGKNYQEAYQKSIQGDDQGLNIYPLW